MEGFSIRSAEMHTEILNIIEYYAAYALMFFFIIYRHKELYKAACGGNGIPQPNEVMQLAAPFLFFSHFIEFQYGGQVFNWEFCGILMAITGVSVVSKEFGKSGTKNKSTSSEVDTSESG